MANYTRIIAEKTLKPAPNLFRISDTVYDELCKLEDKAKTLGLNPDWGMTTINLSFEAVDERTLMASGGKPRAVVSTLVITVCTQEEDD